MDEFEKRVGELTDEKMQEWLYHFAVCDKESMHKENKQISRQLAFESWVCQKLAGIGYAVDVLSRSVNKG